LNSYEHDEGGQILAPHDDNDEADPDTYDKYVGAEVVLPKGDVTMNPKVRGRKDQADRTLRGKAHADPILNTRTYEVEFADGQLTELAANFFAENMLAQCNSKGNQYLLLTGNRRPQKGQRCGLKRGWYVYQTRVKFAVSENHQELGLVS
jgi:hypothetical protein